MADVPPSAQIAKQQKAIDAVGTDVVPEPTRRERVASRAKNIGAELLDTASDYFADSDRPHLRERVRGWAHRLRGEPNDESETQDEEHEQQSQEELGANHWVNPLDEWNYLEPRVQLDALRDLSYRVRQLNSQHRIYATMVLSLAKKQRELARVAYETARQRLGENPRFGEMYQQGRAALNNMQIAIDAFERSTESTTDEQASELLERCYQLAGDVAESLSRLETSVRIG